MPHLIGMTEQEARETASAAGFRTRVTRADGVARGGTRDYRTDRIGLVLRDGLVIAARVG